MIPAEFDYQAPRSLADALGLLRATPGAKVLSGGMSLLPALKQRLLELPLLVDLGRVPGLDGIARRGERFVLGARATHAAIGISPVLEGLTLVAEAAHEIGDLQVRNLGTIGGSLVHADPAADWPAVFLALDGDARVVGSQGERTVPAARFFTGMLSTAVGPDEVVTEITLAARAGRVGSAYVKMRQPASGFAVVGVAAIVLLDARGRCEHIALGVTGINAVPFRASSAERKLTGTPLADADVASACAAIEEADPLGDLFASAPYRRHLLSVYARRAIARARERAAR